MNFQDNSKNEISRDLLEELRDYSAIVYTFIDKIGRFLVKIQCIQKIDKSIQKANYDYGRIIFSKEPVQSIEIYNILTRINEKECQHFFPDNPDLIKGILSIAPDIGRIRGFSVSIDSVFPGDVDRHFGISMDEPTKVIFYKLDLDMEYEEQLLLSRNCEFFPDIISAFRHLMKLHNSIKIFSGVLFLIPLSNKWFEKVELYFKRVQFELNEPATEEYLCIYYRNKFESRTETFKFREHYNLEFKPDHLHILLINSQYLILDKREWKNEHGYRKNKGIRYKYSEEEIYAILEEKENQTIEFKNFDTLSLEEKNRMELFETITSFANTDGGTILLGIEENNGDFKIVQGFTDTRSLFEIQEQLGHLIKAHSNPYIDFYIDFVEINKKKILIIEIVEGNLTPYQWRFKDSVKYYSRKDSSDYEATREELIDLCNKRNSKDNAAIIRLE